MGKVIFLVLSSLGIIASAHAQIALDAATCVATNGDIAIKIHSAVVTHKLKMTDVISESSLYTLKEQVLIVTVGIINLNESKKYDYSTWRDNALAMDQNTNVLKRINYGNNYPTEGIKKRASLYPNKPIKDVLIFERPLASTTHIAISIPAKNIEGSGDIFFMIPKSMIKVQ